MNARHTNWNNNNCNPNGRTLNKLLSNSNNVSIQFTPNNYTHFPINGMSPSTIDIILNKNVQEASDPIALCDLQSDHNPILTTINNFKTKEFKLTKTTYKDTNWKQYRNYINNKLNIKYIQTTNDLNEVVLNFTNILKNAKQKFAKIITFDPYKDILPQHITDLIKQKNKERKHWQQTANPSNLHNMIYLNSIIKQEITNHTNNLWNKKLKSLNPQDNTLWEMTRNLKKSFQPISALTKTGSNIILTSNKEKAEELAKNFEKYHTIPENNNVQQNISNAVKNFLIKNKINSNMLSSLLTTPKEVADILKLLPNGKAAGLDGIDNILLKNLTKKGIVQLTIIINGIMKTGHFPQLWRKALIIPILKSGKDPKQTSSYRPISLLSTLSKVAEKVILKKLNKEIKKLKLKQNSQFGFKEKHNTVHQVTRIVTDKI